jgi:cytosine/adenosine deaminase-related metal-dependent hydrolase
MRPMGALSLLVRNARVVTMDVVLPGLRAYRREDVEVAARLYCLEALRSGVTTFDRLPRA